MSITDILNIADRIINQNRDVIEQKGTNGLYKIEGEIDRNKYVIGFNNGRIGQFYKK